MHQSQHIQILTVLAKLSWFFVELYRLLGDELVGLIESLCTKTIDLADFGLVDILVRVQEGCDFVDLVLLVDQSLHEVTLDF